MFAGWLGRHRGALCVGLATTAVVTLLHGLGATQRLEWWFLDQHFRYANRIDESPRIVHVDIDDTALERVGSWPWPRDVQAGFIRILGELGAEAIVVDLVYSEPRPPELRLPEFSRFEAVAGSGEQLGEPSAENIVYPDDELAAAVREAGTVTLAAFFKSTRTLTPVEKRIFNVLRQDVEADVEAVAAACQLDVELVRRVGIVTPRRRAIAQRVAEVMDAHPDAGAKAAHEAIASTLFDQLTPIGEEIKAAYALEHSLRLLAAGCGPVPPGLAGRLASIEAVTPPLAKLIEAARHTGFVVFEPDEDGTLRRLPLMLEFRGRLVKQLAFSGVCEALEIRDEDLSIDDAGDLHIAARGDRAAMRIPLDAERCMLPNWHRRGESFANSFVHVPMSKVMEVEDIRRRQRENEQLKETQLGRVMQLVKDETAFAGYAEEVRQYLAARRALRATERTGAADSPEAADLRRVVEAGRQRIEADQASTIEFVREVWAELRDEDPDDPEIAADFRRFKTAHDILVGPVAEVDATNAVLIRRAAEAMDLLRPLVAEKTCFVGYTATAMADMVDTPVFLRTPGVMAHSNLYNTFMQRAFIDWSSPWLRAAVLFFAGVLVTFWSASRGPRMTFVLVVVTMLGLVVLNLFTLAVLNYWLVCVVAVLLAFIVWAIVVMYRLLVTEREKRRFSKALAQYTSPAIARQIAEKMDQVDLSPVDGEVTCFFSDLAGFTPLTEKYLDPAKTRSVLNPYLEAMSEVLMRRSALINKFMGDGIFAFINPPVYLCADHARQACAAAVESQRALRELIARQQGSPLAHVFDLLRMRIGLASGPVFVGDYGSENKLDYTCVGDTVNLAARLESANKAFGTYTMVSQTTRDAAGDGFAFRSLGAVQVKGKSIAVPIHELLGWAGEVDPAEVEYADRFGTAVAHFQARRWTDAAAGFDGVLRRRPDDMAARRYAELTRAYQTSPPPADWNGAIELTEK